MESAIVTTKNKKLSSFFFFKALGLNPGPRVCQVHILPLSYTPSTRLSFIPSNTHNKTKGLLRTPRHLAKDVLCWLSYGCLALPAFISTGTETLEYMLDGDVNSVTTLPAPLFDLLAAIFKMGYFSVLLLQKGLRVLSPFSLDFTL